MPMNDKSFEHRCKNGIFFTATRTDFKDGTIIAHLPYAMRDADEVELASATAEMIGWHAANVRQYLEDFKDYDNLKFDVVIEAEEKVGQAAESSPAV